MTHKIDSYSRIDNHWVDDSTGYICPATLDEFFQRYPHYIDGQLRKTWTYATLQMREDMVQDVYLWMCKRRMVENFDPAKFYGCSEQRCLSYINLCVKRRIQSIYEYSTRQPLSAAIGLADDTTDPDDIQDRHQILLHDAGYTDARDMDANIYLDELAAYIRKTYKQRSKIRHTIDVDVLIDYLYARAQATNGNDAAEIFGHPAWTTSRLSQMIKLYVRKFTNQKGRLKNEVR